MKKLLMVLGCLLLLHWGQSEGRWNRATTNSAGCVSVAQGQSSIGFAGSSTNDCVYKTVNGGQNWTTSVLFTNPYDVCNVWSGNANNAYVVGSGGGCAHTSDGGLNWYSRNTGVTFDLYGVSSPTNSPQYVFACGNSNTMISSTNYGQSWRSTFLPANSVFNDIYALNSNEIWTCGSLNGKPYIIRSTNGGSIWAYLGDTTRTNEACTGIKPASSSTGYISTSRGYVYRYSGSLVHLPVIDATACYQAWSNSSTIVFAVGYSSARGGDIWRSDNSGSNWGHCTLQYATSSNFNDICFGSGSNNGIAVGGGGIYYTTDGGLPGVEEEESKGEIGVTKHSFRISPNPMSTSTLLSFNAKTSEKAKVAIHDVAGNLVGSLEIVPNRPTAWDARGSDGRKLPAGVYFLRATAGDFTATEKVVIAR